MVMLKIKDELLEDPCGNAGFICTNVKERLGLESTSTQNIIIHAKFVRKCPKTSIHFLKVHKERKKCIEEEF